MFAFSSSAQVSFFYNDSQAEVTANLIKYVTDSSQIRSWQRYQQIKNELKPLGNNKTNLSYQNKMLWLYIPFAAIKGHEQLHYLMIRNPHINFIGAWVIKGDSLIKSFPLSGDHKLFRQRPIIHPDFVFEV